MGNELEEAKKSLKFVEEAKKSIESQLNLTTGLILGLIFGIFGSYFATITYEEVIKGLNPIPKVLSMIIPILVLFFLIYIGNKEFKRIRNLKRDIETFEKWLKNYLNKLENEP